MNSISHRISTVGIQVMNSQDLDGCRMVIISSKFRIHHRISNSKSHVEEVGPNGYEISKRRLVFGVEDTVEIQVANWKDLSN